MADPTAVRDDGVRLLSALRLAARSLTAHGRPDLDTTIQQIVTSAVDTVVPAAGGGISRTTGSTVHSAYATDGYVRRLDQLQSELEEGPCVTAAAHPPKDGVVLAVDLDGPDRDRWPAFSAHAVGLGYRSLLSLHLSGAGGHGSALNLYAHEPDAFDDEAVTTASLFSLQAAILLHGADDAENLRHALETRDLIGQAKGVLTERFHLGDDDAFAMLVQASQVSNIKLVEVARWLLDDARRTAKGPISGPPTGGPPLRGRPPR